MHRPFVSHWPHDDGYGYNGQWYHQPRGMVLLQARMDNNYGRWFFCCPCWHSHRNCRRFLWADDREDQCREKAEAKHERTLARERARVRELELERERERARGAPAGGRERQLLARLAAQEARAAVQSARIAALEAHVAAQPGVVKMEEEGARLGHSGATHGEARRSVARLGEAHFVDTSPSNLLTLPPSD